jgi:peptidoglycan biosynthesis protein MviN/MurJ (putative lipid II flippase)
MPYYLILIGIVLLVLRMLAFFPPIDISWSVYLGLLLAGAIPCFILFTREARHNKDRPVLGWQMIISLFATFIMLVFWLGLGLLCLVLRKDNDQPAETSAGP